LSRPDSRGCRRWTSRTCIPTESCWHKATTVRTAYSRTVSTAARPAMGRCRGRLSRRLPEKNVAECEGFSFACKECWQEQRRAMWLPARRGRRAKRPASLYGI
jgi:hypothetical protein